MDIRKLQRLVVDALEDTKAQDIKVFNTIGLSDIFDRVVVASGSSNRQTRAMADRVVEKVKEAGGHVMSVEGDDTGEWVLVDLGDAVVHVMLPPIRAYYDLEEMWGGKPVKVSTGAKAAASRRFATEPIEDETAPVTVDAMTAGTPARPATSPPAGRATRAPTATRPAAKTRGAAATDDAAPVRRARKAAAPATSPARSRAAPAPKPARAGQRATARAATPAKPSARAPGPSARKTAGKAAGKTMGRTAGKTAGRTMAKAAGKSAGQSAGKPAGKSASKSAGKSAGTASRGGRLATTASPRRRGG